MGSFIGRILMALSAGVEFQSVEMGFMVKREPDGARFFLSFHDSVALMSGNVNPIARP
jgi:hypothetical protein